jgi:DNA polymerase I-like protein with 3'-5' exonuclease and polymerase domains
LICGSQLVANWFLNVESDWRPRGEYPSLRGARFIGIDCETCDPSLEEKGPGAIRGDGFLAGISIATEGFNAYFPIAHEGGDNLPRDVVLRYLARELSGNEPKVGANIGYDLEWLHCSGVRVGGPKLDIQIAEALIDENSESLALEQVSTKYLGKGKDEALLRAAAAARGWRTPKQVKQNLWRLPARFVGPYAEFDAEAALRVYLKQLDILRAENLEAVFALESRLVDVLLAIRLRGVPISYDKAEQAMVRLGEEQRLAQQRLNQLAGIQVDPWSSPSIASAFDKLCLPYGRTEKGNPSFTADWLETQQHEFAKNLVTVRKLDRSANVFIKNKIIGFAHRGRLHPLFKQTRQEDGGTRSGRLSSSKPNMQQVPARNPILSPIIRGIFIPDDGYQFGVFDYSQQEPRVTVHYGYLKGYKGAAEARDRYIANPRIDYHQMVADMALETTGNDIGRKNAKTLNLGMAYGMGLYKLSTQLGISVDAAKPLLNAYHAAVPYVRLLGDDAMRQAKRRGWIKTIMGRRRHFPGGEFAHKALNAAVQGSSADMIKLALCDLHDAGHVIYNTVHDEVDAPVRDKKHADEIAEILVNCVKLEVPLVVDAEIGPSWGEVA